MSEPYGHIGLCDLLVLHWNSSSTTELVVIVLKLSEEAIEIVEEQEVHQSIRDVHQVEAQSQPVLLLHVIDTVEDHVREGEQELHNEDSYK